MPVQQSDLVIKRATTAILRASVSLIRALALAFTLLISVRAVSAAPDSKTCEELLTVPPIASEKPAAVVDASTGEVKFSSNASFYAGQPLNTDRYRPATDLKIRPGEFMEFKGFLHKGVYHQARVNLSDQAIESTIVQAQPFPIAGGEIIAGHIQMRFKMRPGFEVELTQESDPSKKTKVKDFILSFEAALPKGESYNFVYGFLKTSPVVGRIISGEQKRDEGPKRPFDQYEIHLSGEERAAVARMLVEHSASIGYNVFYNTVLLNCSSEIFDAIDRLPRIQALIAAGKITPFMTTIGTDPVVGPTIKALLERDPGTRHIQDMKDEYAGKLEDFGVAQAPPPKRSALLPGGLNPNVTVMLKPSQESLTPAQRQAVETIQKKIEALLRESLNSVMAAAMTATSDMDSSTTVLNQAVQPLLERLRNELRSVNAELPDAPYILQLMLTPYASPNSTDLRGIGLRAQLSGAIVTEEITTANRAEIFSSIQQGIGETDVQAEDQVPVFVRSLNLRVNLQKDKSFVDSQILLGLNEVSSSTQVRNDQVHLDRVTIKNPQTSWWDWMKSPFASQKAKRRASVLITHHQDTNANLQPTVRVTFGQAVTLANETTLENAGNLVIQNPSGNKFFCWPGRQPYGPRLTGVFAGKPVGTSWFGRMLNRLLVNRPVTMSITDIELNMSTMKIESMRIRVGALGLRCLELDSVNQQFGSEANAMLSDLIQKMGQSVPMVNLVAP
jgi:hypothetical protein